MKLVPSTTPALLAAMVVASFLSVGHASSLRFVESAPAGQFNGRLVLLRTYGDFCTTCRRVKITNEAGDFGATSVRDLCKDQEGNWKVLK